MEHFPEKHALAKATVTSSNPVGRASDFNQLQFGSRICGHAGKRRVSKLLQMGKRHEILFRQRTYEGYLIAGGGLTRREPCYQQKECFHESPTVGIHAQGAVAQNWCSGHELVLANGSSISWLSSKSQGESGSAWDHTIPACGISTYRNAAVNQCSEPLADALQQLGAGHGAPEITRLTHLNAMHLRQLGDDLNEEVRPLCGNRLQRRLAMRRSRQRGRPVRRPQV